MNTAKTMVNVSPKMSNRDSTIERDLERFVKMFSTKAVQAIVQSRLGDKMQTFSNPRSLSYDWVSELQCVILNCITFISKTPWDLLFYSCVNCIAYENTVSCFRFKAKGERERDALQVNQHQWNSSVFFFLNVRKHFATHLFAITNYMLGLIGQDAYRSHHTRAHIKSNKCANVHIISLHENMLQGIKKRMKLSLTWPPFNIHMWVI